MNLLEEKTIGEIVAEDYRTASVFKAFEIDFCCGGSRTISEVCGRKGILIEKLQDALDNATQQKGHGRPDFNHWSLDLLADYIEKKHHRYVRAKVPELSSYLEKLCKVHGQNHPELFEVRKLFNASADELYSHMHKEEKILFPVIRSLAEAEIAGIKNIHLPPFGTVENPINMMRHEHDIEGERFKIIRELTNGYTPPMDACTTYRVAFAQLIEFEEDLHQHIHLENNILFPKAMQLEGDLMDRIEI